MKSSKRPGRKAGKLVRIVGHTSWKVVRNPKTGIYIGECDALNVTAQGNTRAGLLRMIDDILQTLLTDMVLEGRLEKVAREQGWQIEGELPVGRLRAKDLKFDLPFVVPEVIAPHVAAA